MYFLGDSTALKLKAIITLNALREFPVVENCNLILFFSWFAIEAPPRGFREQENMAISFLGTREQKENKTGNMGTKAYFREQGTPKSKKYF